MSKRFNYEADQIHDMVHPNLLTDTTHYVAECKDIILTEATPNYPKLTDYESEWLYFYEHEYQGGGDPVNLEYQEVIVNPYASVANAIPFKYKRASLKGQTLVNLFDVNNAVCHNPDWYVDENGYMVIPVVNKVYNHIVIPKEKCSMFKPSTKYTLWVHMLENHTEDNGDGTTEQPSSFMLQSYSYGSTIVKNSNQGTYGCRFENNEIGVKTCVFETHDLESWTDKSLGIQFDLSCYYAKTGGIQKLAIVILEGEYSIDELPFNATFEGMQSVQMPVLKTTGKNLFDISKEQKNITINIINGNVDVETYDRNTSDFIKVIPNTIYTCNVPMTRLAYYDKNKQFISHVTSVSQPTTIPTSCNFVKFSYDNTLSNIQFEQGTTATSYESYKTNILTVNEDVTLRGIGDVKDELNLLTGELIKNFGSIYFDGSENWKIYNRTGTMAIAKLNVPNLNHNFSANTSLADKIPVVAQAWSGAKGVSLLNQDVYLAVEQSIANTDDDLKRWLSSIGGINLIYRLSQSTIKTVDLSTSIRPYEGTNHYYTSSDTIPPSCQLSVPIESTGTKTLNDITQED